MTFAKRSDLCNSLAFLSAWSMADHLNPWTLDPLNLLYISVLPARHRLAGWLNSYLVHEQKVMFRQNPNI
jgi:hypothetical protein